MASFSRLLSHPAIVGLLQTGAGFTQQMQKDREEEERLRRELAMTTFERQMQNLDADKARSQQQADEATRDTRDFAQSRYMSGVGSNNPNEVEDAQNAAIELNNPDMLASATSRAVDLKNYMLNKTASDAETAFTERVNSIQKNEPEEQIAQLEDWKSQLKGTPYQERVQVFIDTAKRKAAEKKKVDTEQTKQWELDNAHVLAAKGYILQNPDAPKEDRLAWGVKMKLGRAGLEALEEPNETERALEQSRKMSLENLQQQARPQQESGFGQMDVSALLGGSATNGANAGADQALQAAMASQGGGATAAPDTAKANEVGRMAFKMMTGKDYPASVSPVGAAAAAPVPPPPTDIFTAPRSGGPAAPAAQRDTSGLLPDEIGEIEELARRWGLDPANPADFNQARKKAESMLPNTQVR